jgi:hypothetical protein
MIESMEEVVDPAVLKESVGGGEGGGREGRLRREESDES